MQNAHLRLGLLEYQRATEKISTRIRVRVDRYVGEDRKAHLLSVFGNDSDIGAITAAVHEKATFTLTFPDGNSKEVTLGENPSCYKGSVSYTHLDVYKRQGMTRRRLCFLRRSAPAQKTPLSSHRTSCSRSHQQQHVISCRK